MPPKRASYDRINTVYRTTLVQQGGGATTTAPPGPTTTATKGDASEKCSLAHRCSSGGSDAQRKATTLATVDGVGRGQNFASGAGGLAGAGGSTHLGVFAAVCRSCENLLVVGGLTPATPLTHKMFTARARVGYIIDARAFGGQTEIQDTNKF